MVGSFGNRNSYAYIEVLFQFCFHAFHGMVVITCISSHKLFSDKTFSSLNLLKKQEIGWDRFCQISVCYSINGKKNSILFVKIVVNRFPRAHSCFYNFIFLLNKRVTSAKMFTTVKKQEKSWKRGWIGVKINYLKFFSFLFLPFLY